ncbi:MAG: ABC transporter substrate-binding protein [Kineothrix sp.]
MKKRFVSLLMAAVMAAGAAITGCGSSGTAASADTETPAQSEAPADTEAPAEEAADSGKKEVLEFYHGYYHDASEWAPAAVMREIYDDFAKTYATGNVEFKAIPSEDIKGVVENSVAGGSYPDMIDLAGNSVSLAAMSQNLLVDMKPYIDEQGIQANVGINYTQNDVGGRIYTVHDQLLTLGYWYNDKILKDAGAADPNTWQSWEDFDGAMEAVRAMGTDLYAYGAGQGSARCFNAILGTTEAGREMLTGALTEEAVNAPEFAEAFKTVAAMDQKNGSANASADASDGANDWGADFNQEKSAVFFNGVWAAGGFEDITNIRSTIFPGSVSLSSASGGITIAAGMSAEKEALALEFVKYMTSDEVQTRIFKEVGANPCSTTLDLNALVADADDKTKLLAEACAQANAAQNVVPTLDAVWGSDIANAIGNKLIESTVSGTDIDAKFEELKNELIGLIG